VDRRLRKAHSEQRDLLERERNNFRQQQKQMTREADELFANLQGLPMPAATSANSLGDG
jgi:hypothetical protein